MKWSDIEMLILALLMLTEPKVVNLSQWDVFRPSLFDVSQHGVTCILDRDNVRLVFLDQDQTLITFAGRKGAGPGEFKSLANVAWNSADGHFWVYEWRGRLSSWDESGKMIGEYPMKPVLRDVMVLDHQNILYSSDDFGRPGSSPKIIATGLKNQAPRTVWAHAPLKQAVGYHRGDPPSFSFKLAWSPRLVSALGQRHYAVCYNQTNDIFVFRTSDHSEVATLHPTAKTVEVTKAVFDAALKERFIDQATFLDIAPFVRFEPDTYWPVVQAVKFDHRDRLWVFTQSDRGYRYSVYELDGRMIGSGATPVDPRFMVFHGGDQYTCIENEDGEIVFSKGAMMVD